MTTKQIEKLHQQCIKFDMDFNDLCWQLDEVKFIIRWSKKQKAERLIVRQKLEEKGCFSIEHLRIEVNLDWI
jgi:uncharacterized protein YgbK (DUF1537 family)